MSAKILTKSPGAGLRAVVALLTAVLIGTVAATAAPVSPASHGVTISSSHGVAIGPIHVVSSTVAAAGRSWSYTWPVKPFDRQHAIRAFLNDPRIGHHGGKAFHFGVDISAPDGTAVYAVEGGKVFFSSAEAISVEAPDRSHEFGYWHIVPVVKSHQIVARHQLLGYIAKGWEHVHFAERRGGIYLNPLRNGGLGPYADHTAPTVAAISASSSTLVVVAYDMPDPRVPGDWANEPVTPALLRWRVEGGRWHTGVDFRHKMLDRRLFATIYTPATRQNHKGEPGNFSFHFHWSVSGRQLAAAALTIEVAASDTAGNCTIVAAQISPDV
jgi:hypothetical protein